MLWEIKITRNEKEISITGQIVKVGFKNDESTQIKLIKIPNIEADIFLKKHCSNKLRKLINHLKVDENDGSLLLIVP